MSLMTDFRGHTQVDTELSLGSVTGYRGWKIDSYGRLRGVSGYSQRSFRPGVNPARCYNGSGTLIGADHNMLSCTCGFYAYFAESAKEAEDYDVMGVVRGTGQTVVGDLGFRAQKAEILAAYVPELNNGKMHLRVLRALLPTKYATCDSYNRNSPSDGLRGAGWAIAGLGAAVFLIAAFIGPWGALLAGSIALLVGGSILFESYTWYKPWRRERREPRLSRTVPTRRLEALRLNYPDVPLFASKRKMLRKFPLSKAAQFSGGSTHFRVNAANSDNFWEL